MPPIESSPDEAPTTEYVPFDGTDVEVGPIALGTRRFAELSLDSAVDLVETAVRCGVTLIDTADVWGYRPTDEDPRNGGGFGAAETRLGEVFAEAPELRSQVVVATKGGVFPPVPLDSGADHLRQACDASLYRMGIEVIDLYQVHCADLVTHPAEVAEVLADLRDAGKVREVGVVGYTASQIRALQAFLDVPLVSSQMACNLLRTAAVVDGSLDVAMELGLTPIASSPLGSGRLAGERSGSVPAPSGEAGARARGLDEVLARIAGEQSVSRSAVALAWLLHHPAGVVPALSTVRPARLRSAASAVDVDLSRQQWYELWSVATGAPVVDI